jgi:hypothetical protein
MGREETRRRCCATIGDTPPSPFVLSRYLFDVVVDAKAKDVVEQPPQRQLLIELVLKDISMCVKVHGLGLRVYSVFVRQVPYLCLYSV